MNTQSTQRFVSDIAPRRYASRLGSTHGTATQLNSTICFLPRYLTRRSAAPLDPTQRFVYYDATRLMALLRSSALLNSTICLLRRVAPHGAAPYRNVAQLNSTICFLHRSVPLRSASLHNAPHLDATQRFVFYNATNRGSTYRPASLLNATQRFVCYQRTFPASRRPKSRRPASQLDDLFLTANRNSALRSATQLNVIAN